MGRSPRGPATAAGALAIALALSGCVTSTLQLGRAGTMVEAGNAATAASRKTIDETAASYRRYLVELAAFDPNCQALSSTLEIGPGATGGCIIEQGGRGHKVLGPSQAYAKISLATINGMVAYLDAVDAIATRKPIDIAGTLTDARDQLEGVISNINGIVGSNLSLPVSEDQLKSAKTILDLISGLISSADQVRDLRRIEAKLDDNEFRASLDALRAISHAWTDALATSLKLEGAQIDGVRGYQASAMLALCPPGSASDCRYTRIPAADRAEYRATADRSLAVTEQLAKVQATREQLDKLLDAFGEAHASYRALLFDPHAKLSLAERRLKAAEIRKRILSALKGLLAVAALF
ncbi:hypothetical protein [Sphingomonas sp.]|uniref:hypothetical protein n=1 Tax=Sphingomonas sp. TaxID=28214 RepID=UPI001B01C123|nr:hypothetical protein [Sphingomonas sp.]MBO9712733.1 hypothetical protein [Sphingomonas sp.]